MHTHETEQEQGRHHPHHDHFGHHHHTGDSLNNIRVAFFLNLGFTIFEIVGGLWTNSLAILSDALHDLGDSFSLGMSWYLHRLSTRGRDNHYSYGYRRFSLLGALLNTLVLMGGSVVIIGQAIPRVLHPEESNAPGMVLFAVMGILVNGAAVLKLRGGHSLNERAVALHLLEDVLGWVAVLAVSVILLFTDWHFLDPLLSLMITLYVLMNVFKNLRKTLTLFLQGVPEDVDLQQLDTEILKLTNVISTHHTHVWSLDGERHVLSTHVVIPHTVSREDVLKLKEDIRGITERMNFAHTTVEVEYSDEECRIKEDC